MSRNLARRGASVLVAGVLLGGGLALGGGTASAVEIPPGSNGSAELLGSPVDWAAAAVLAAGAVGGSVDPGDLTFYGCSLQQGKPCNIPSPSEILLALLQGRDPHAL
ncbi:hypothetical protein [Rhodococcus sp. UNC363MFTsu5.1]|uniref:hypothetical protein n=1 Tax=Rhodococcus sp. UNC363MFTsu5.1 TaxID=1449069 RepID=UPI000488953B|nr:hypothetical protein [Rhodococcus sp. UNC363MFTsu5.1]